MWFEFVKCLICVINVFIKGFVLFCLRNRKLSFVVIINIVWIGSNWRYIVIFRVFNFLLGGIIFVVKLKCFKKILDKIIFIK